MEQIDIESELEEAWDYIKEAEHELNKSVANAEEAQESIDGAKVTIKYLMQKLDMDVDDSEPEDDDY